MQGGAVLFSTEGWERVCAWRGACWCVPPHSVNKWTPPSSNRPSAKMTRPTPLLFTPSLPTYLYTYLTSLSLIICLIKHPFLSIYLFHLFLFCFLPNKHPFFIHVFLIFVLNALLMTSVYVLGSRAVIWHKLGFLIVQLSGQKVKELLKQFFQGSHIKLRKNVKTSFSTFPPSCFVTSNTHLNSYLVYSSPVLQWPHYIQADKIVRVRFGVH